MKNKPSPTGRTKSSYLSKLRFDPALLLSSIAKYLTNIRLVGLLVIAILILGTSSFLTIPQRLNPEIEIPIISIVTTLPGASPNEVETLLTIPIEDELSSISGIDSISSNSSDSVSAITIQFLSTVSQKQAKDDVQSAVDTIVGLPDDAQNPRVIAFDFENQPIYIFSITSTGDTASLLKFSEIIQDELENITKVDRVVVAGDEEQEITIEILPETIQTLGLNPLQLTQSIQAALSAYPSGTVSTNNSTFSFSVNQSVFTLDELRQLPLTLENTQYLLQDIATVSLTSPRQEKTYYATSATDPNRAVTVYVYKTKSATVDGTVEEVSERVEELIDSYGNTFQITIIEDSAQLIEDQFSDLGSNFTTTIFLVFVTLLLFLGIRQALIVSLSIPLTFLISFTVMKAAGLSLNFLSLFSLLLALGLLVDDAIVIISAMTSYYRSGKFTPVETGLLVWKDFIVPIWTTTITTVWAFAPLLLSTGIIGEFIKTIPIVVSSTLLASTSVAVLITLPLMMSILKPSIPKRVLILFGTILIAGGMYVISSLASVSYIAFPATMIGLFATWFGYRHRNTIGKRISSQFHHTNKQRIHSAVQKLTNGFVDLEKIRRRYYSFILDTITSQVARRKTIAAVVGFSVFSYLLVPAGFVVNEFFPKTDQDTVYVSVSLPSGTNIEQTDQEAQTLLDSLKHTEGVSHVFAEIGRSFDPSGDGAGESGSNTILFTLVLPPESERTIGSIRIADTLREQYETYDKGDLSVVEVSGGPPAGADIQIQLKGEDLQILSTLAEDVMNHLVSLDGVANVDQSIKPSTSKISFVPDPVKIEEAGLRLDQVGLWTRTYANGLKIDELTLDQTEHEIILRISPEIKSPESINALAIPTSNGPISLSTLGTLTLEPNPTQITRNDGKRTISVFASVLPGYSTSQTNAQLEQYADTSLSLPAGYSWETGGVNEENQRSVTSIMQAMLLAAILILTTMVIQLGSFRKALIVMLVIPLALSGVFIMFALTGTPLSFPALIGVLALFGIVVNNSIVVVEKINQNLSIGIPFAKAISDAAASRLEPILFSSMTTIIGLTPITLSDPLWQGLGGAIISGLLFSGTIMLLFIPTMYYVIFNPDRTAV